MIKNKSMFCIFCQQQSKIHVLSASPDLHGSLYLCLLPQARTSDLTYDVGVEVDYFEYILLGGSFFFGGTLVKNIVKLSILTKTRCSPTGL